MKKGRFSLLALGILFFLFMVFMLFRTGFNGGGLSTSITGFFLFDPAEVVATNVSVPLEGNFSFTIAAEDITGAGDFKVTNNSFIRMSLVNAPGRVIKQKWLLLQDIEKKTVPNIVFTDSAPYRIPAVGKYKINVTFSEIVPDASGSYTLVFNLWYNSTLLKQGSNVDRAVLVNLSEAGQQPPPSGQPALNVTNVSIGAIDTDVNGGIVSIRKIYMAGDRLLCSFSYQNSSPLTMTIKFFRKGDSTNAISIITDVNKIQCIGRGFCQTRYTLDIDTLEDLRCSAELTDTAGNTKSNYSEFIPISFGPPVLVEDIPNIELTEETYNFSLDGYFIDPAGGILTYQVWGVAHSLINITGDIVRIEDVSHYNGEDVVYFRAYNKNNGFTDSNNVTIYYGTATASDGSGCVPGWECSEWGDCVKSLQERKCLDKNSCDLMTGKPAESQRCTVIDEAGAAGAAQTSGGGLPIQYQRIESSDNTVLYVVLAVVLVLVLGGGGFAVYYFKFMKKDEDEEEQDTTGGIVGESTVYKAQPQAAVQVQTTATTDVKQEQAANISEVYKYLDESAAAGNDINVSKDELLKAGWEKKDVERAVNVTTLKKYAAGKTKAGFDKEKIRETLIAKGWKQDILDDVFAEKK